MSIAPFSTNFQELCSTPSIQHISVNGQPLHALGRIEQVWENILGSPELIGNAIHAPLRPGALNIPRVIGPREFGLGMVIYGANDKDIAGHNDRWRTLARLLWSPVDPLVMEREIAIGSGTETHECNAQYIEGLQPEYTAGMAMSRIALRFVNLDGYWYAQSDSVAVVPAGGGATLTMPGDGQTRRMRIIFSGGGASVHTLTNSTNGCVLSYTGTTSPEVDFNVFAFTADQAGTNVMKNVTHAGDVFWMRMEPGVNALQFDGGGTATVRVRAAYL